MDTTCLQYTLTEEERRQFEEDGFFIVRDVLPLDLVAQLIPVVDRLDAEARRQKGIEKHQMHNFFDFIGKDELFLELLDWPKTFAKVFGILGWHIQLYHSHLIVTPPLDGVVPKRKRLGWHQDSGRLNIDMETEPSAEGLAQSGVFSHRLHRDQSRQFPRGTRLAPEKQAGNARGRRLKSSGRNADPSGGG